MVELPEFVYIGRTVGEWPMVVMENDAHALDWVKEDPRRRRVWLVRLEEEAEMEYVPPGDASLRRKEGL